MNLVKWPLLVVIMFSIQMQNAYSQVLGQEEAEEQKIEQFLNYYYWALDECGFDPASSSPECTNVGGEGENALCNCDVNCPEFGSVTVAFQPGSNTKCEEYTAAEAFAEHGTQSLKIQGI